MNDKKEITWEEIIKEVKNIDLGEVKKVDEFRIKIIPFYERVFEKAFKELGVDYSNFNFNHYKNKRIEDVETHQQALTEMKIELKLLNLDFDQIVSPSGKEEVKAPSVLDYFIIRKEGHPLFKDYASGIGIEFRGKPPKREKEEAKINVGLFLGLSSQTLRETRESFNSWFKKNGYLKTYELEKIPNEEEIANELSGIIKKFRIKDSMG